ncbi:MAG TPA: polyheme membrane-associated cytochrome C [Xanthobacteraceae bacterium]|nr:polyheme membrane-associated cytochrome C [Xanthobacteraceae bacterium]
MNALRQAGLVTALAMAATAVLTGTGRPQNEGASSGPVIHFGKGHFNRAARAFHEWDNAKEIPAVCARCHGANSVPEYLREGKNSPAPHAKNAFACTNCHADLLSYARHAVAKVTFASGITLDSGNNDANLCMTCHQGRESTASVDKAIAGLAPDTPDPKLSFVHVHYFPAGATRYGTEAKVAYEYAGKTYAGRFAHVPSATTCTACHEPHAGEVAVNKCGGCHQGVASRDDLANIRMSSRGDFDGNGREEGIARELANLHRELYAAIQQYARTVGGAGIAFTYEEYPYWYTDLNGNGKIDHDEVRPDNTYKAYTPRLLQAAYNYTFVLRDPGAAYHNGRYSLQLIYDSLESLAASGKAGVDMRGKVRP